MENIKYPVDICIAGIQKSEGEKDENTTKAKGDCYLRSGRYYILYTEEAEGQIIKNKIRIGEDDVEVIKTGAVDTKMRFKKGEVYAFTYNTPFGAILMTIHTKRLLMEENEGYISAFIEYDLMADGRLISNSEIRISVNR